MIRKGPQLLHQAALAGDAELGGEIAVDAGDDIDCVLLGHEAPPVQRFLRDIVQTYHTPFAGKLQGKAACPP